MYRVQITSDIVKKFFWPEYSVTLDETRQKNRKFIKMIFDRGGYGLPANMDGRPLTKDLPGNRIKNFDYLKIAYHKGTRRFIFRPCTAGLIGIDLDVKSGKDGPALFHHKTEIDPLQYYHVKSPRGLHLYFFCDDGPDYVSSEIFPGIEVKHRAFITLPGSMSSTGKYTARGHPSQITPLPETLKNILPIKQKHTFPDIRPPMTSNLSLEKIGGTLEKQGYHFSPGNRNNFIFQFAKFAKKQGHGPDEIINFLSQYAMSDFSLREIFLTTNSTFTGRGH